MPVIALLHKLAPFADPVLCATCMAKVYASKGTPLRLQDAFKLTIEDMSFEELVELQRAAAELVLETLRSVSRPDDLGGGFMPELDEVEEQEEVEEVEEVEAEELEKGPPVEAGAPVVPGWIVRKKVALVKVEKKEKDVEGVEGVDFNWANEDFSPLLPEMEQEYLVPFASFHRCVDEFFTQLEENKARRALE